MPETVTSNPIFGAISGYGVFVVPADANKARDILRALRIRATDAGEALVDGYGLTPGHAADRGTPARVFYVTHAAKMKLYAAGMIDRERVVLSGDN